MTFYNIHPIKNRYHCRNIVLLKNSDETENYGAVIAKKHQNGGLVFLQGELGAGKTTLARGILRYFGFKGAVRSPTYTLVETYNLDRITIHHFDLYRLELPYELEDMGFRDYLSKTNLVLIEWPEKAQEILSPADINIVLEYHNEGRKLKLLE